MTSAAQNAYDLIVETFNATPVWVTRGGVTVHGSPPDYISWPMVRGDEFATGEWERLHGLKR